MGRALIAAIFLLGSTSTVSSQPTHAVATYQPPSRRPFAENARSFSVGYFTFPSQPTAEPTVYDSNNLAVCGANPSNTPLTLGIRYVVPDAGVTTRTGLVIELGGIGTPDCPPYAGAFSFDVPGSDPVREAWVNERNVVFAKVFYRNWGFWPYDYGKYKVVDALRGTGAMLEAFPAIDQRRLYLLGGSGGGHLALQLLQVRPDLFAEVYSLCPITRITLPSDVAPGQPYAGDANNSPSGWNANLLPQYPAVQGSMATEEFLRKTDERNLRSPQFGLSRRLPTGVGLSPVFVAHGDADPTTRFRHFEDLIAAVESGAGASATVQGADLCTLNNWTFLRIPGGNHGFAGGPPDRDTRSKAVLVLNPQAFLGVRAAPPSAATFATTVEADNGWAYQYDGNDLTDVSVQTVRLSGGPSRVSDWTILAE